MACSMLARAGILSLVLATAPAAVSLTASDLIAWKTPITAGPHVWASFADPFGRIWQVNGTGFGGELLDGGATCLRATTGKPCKRGAFVELATACPKCEFFLGGGWTKDSTQLVFADMTNQGGLFVVSIPAGSSGVVAANHVGDFANITGVFDWIGQSRSSGAMAPGALLSAAVAQTSSMHDTGIGSATYGIVLISAARVQLFGSLNWAKVGPMTRLPPPDKQSSGAVLMRNTVFTMDGASIQLGFDVVRSAASAPNPDSGCGPVTVWTLESSSKGSYHTISMRSSSDWSLPASASRQLDMFTQDAIFWRMSAVKSAVLITASGDTNESIAVAVLHLPEGGNAIETLWTVTRGQVQAKAGDSDATVSSAHLLDASGRAVLYTQSTVSEGDRYAMFVNVDGNIGGIVSLQAASTFQVVVGYLPPVDDILAIASQDAFTQAYSVIGIKTSSSVASPTGPGPSAGPASTDGPLPWSPGDSSAINSGVVRSVGDAMA